MANPYRGQAKSTNAAKFKAISGKSSSGKAFDGASEDSDKVAKSYRSTATSGPDVPAVKSAKRLDKPVRKATGGAVSKKGTTVNVNVISTPKEDKPIPIPIPDGPPPSPPPGGPPGPMVGAPQLGPPPGPMMRKDGGRVASKFSGGEIAAGEAEVKKGLASAATKAAASDAASRQMKEAMKKDGGRVKMTGGAETGVGRLDKAKAYKRG